MSDGTSFRPPAASSGLLWFPADKDAAVAWHNASPCPSTPRTLPEGYNLYSAWTAEAASNADKAQPSKPARTSAAGKDRASEPASLPAAASLSSHAASRATRAAARAAGDRDRDRVSRDSDKDAERRPKSTAITLVPGLETVVWGHPSRRGFARVQDWDIHQEFLRGGMRGHCACFACVALEHADASSPHSDRDVVYDKSMCLPPQRKSSRVGGSGFSSVANAVVPSATRAVKAEGKERVASSTSASSSSSSHTSGQRVSARSGGMRKADNEIDNATASSSPSSSSTPSITTRATATSTRASRAREVTSMLPTRASRHREKQVRDSNEDESNNDTYDSTTCRPPLSSPPWTSLSSRKSQKELVVVEAELDENESTTESVSCTVSDASKTGRPSQQPTRPTEAQSPRPPQPSQNSHSVPQMSIGEEQKTQDQALQVQEQRPPQRRKSARTSSAIAAGRFREASTDSEASDADGHSAGSESDDADFKGANGRPRRLRRSRGGEASAPVCSRPDMSYNENTELHDEWERPKKRQRSIAALAARATAAMAATAAAMNGGALGPKSLEDDEVSSLVRPNSAAPSTSLTSYVQSARNTHFSSASYLPHDGVASGSASRRSSMSQAHSTSYRSSASSSSSLRPPPAPRSHVSSSSSSFSNTTSSFAAAAHEIQRLKRALDESHAEAHRLKHLLKKERARAKQMERERNDVLQVHQVQIAYAWFRAFTHGGMRWSYD